MHGGNIYSGKIKYDFSVNLNPLGIPSSIKKEWKKILKVSEKYPDLECSEIKKLLSEKMKINQDSILFSNGASEIISGIVLSLHPKKALLLSPCFSGYEKALKVVNTEICFFDLKKEKAFRLDEQTCTEYLTTIEIEKPEIVFLCNPNNPDGNLIEKKLLEKIIGFCEKRKINVVLDECFLELTENGKDFSLISEIEKYENLIVVSAFTKTYSIPGIRLGYGIFSDQEILSETKAILPEWNVSSLAQKTGCLCLEEKNYVSEGRKIILSEREFLSEKLEKIGFEVFTSESNYILFESKKDFDLKEKLLEKNILIRDCSDYRNLGKGFYRIAVRTHKENKILISALKEITGVKKWKKLNM